MFSAKPVQEQREEQQAEERLRLSAAGGEVEQRSGLDRVLVGRIQVREFRHPRRRRNEIRQDEAELE